MCGASGGNATSAWEAVRRYMKESASFGGLEIENMNGVMSGIIEVKPPPIKKQGRFWCEQVFLYLWNIREIPILRRMG